MLLLLNLQNSPILESPLHNIRVGGRILHRLTLGQGAPEIAEVFELDHVPDVAEFGFDDG